MDRPESHLTAKGKQVRSETSGQDTRSWSDSIIDQTRHCHWRLSRKEKRKMETEREERRGRMSQEPDDLVLTDGDTLEDEGGGGNASLDQTGFLLARLQELKAWQKEQEIKLLREQREEMVKIQATGAGDEDHEVLPHPHHPLLMSFEGAVPMQSSGEDPICKVLI